MFWTTTARLSVALLSSVFGLFAAEAYPTPRFTDPERSAKLTAAMPQIDDGFRKYAEALGVPGMVWGVVIDDKLVHVQSAGVSNRTTNEPVTPETVFRIASMTKSFTTLAVLKLRDAGKLSLEDPVSKWIPEFARMPMPTSDTGPIRVKHLLMHWAGFPEDNPWGDQQLSASDAEMTAWLKKGIPFSTVPGSGYEYSNYGFGLLGRIVTAASGVPYRTYLEREILAPLGMKSSTLEVASVPKNKLARGYRHKPDGTYEEEKPLPHGAFGSMGGLLTTAEDLGRYVAFQLSAWPPRSEPESGPVLRSSVREMNHLWNPATLSAGGKPYAQVAGYGYGLRISMDCHFKHIVGHGGGLPGYGSYMAWLPEYGVGIFAMANLTYAGPAAPISRAWDILRGTGALLPRQLPESPQLKSMRESILKVFRDDNMAELHRVAAMNLFLDVPEAQRRDELAKLRSQLGTCPTATDTIPENWLRGTFDLSCERGTARVQFTLAPTQPPALQQLRFLTPAPPAPPSDSVCTQ